MTNMKYTVQQIADLESREALEGGFTSARPAASRGSYLYQFTEEGTFYYWSGPVDASGKTTIL